MIRVRRASVHEILKAEPEEDDLEAEGYVFPHGLTRAEHASLAARLDHYGQLTVEHLVTDEVLEHLKRTSLRHIAQAQLLALLTKPAAQALASTTAHAANVVDTLHQSFWAPAVPKLMHALARRGQAEAQVAIEQIRRSATWSRWLKQGGGNLGLLQARFGAPNPLQIPSLRRTALRIVRGLDDKTLRGMRLAIEDALKAGLNPIETARRLRSLHGFGLTEPQVQALINYRRALEEGRWGEATARALHPRNWKRPITGDQIDRLVARYGERLATYRANVIARTEQLRAANAGIQSVWEEARTMGAFQNARLVRHWIAAPENATFAGIGKPPAYTGRSRSGRVTSGPCPRCVETVAMNPDGRALDEPFQTPDGPVDMPPLHPQCRCVLFVKPVFMTLSERRELA